MAGWFEEQPSSDGPNYLDIMPTLPPKAKPYSVAKHRAKQQIRDAKGCRDISLKRQRLQAALDAASISGLPDSVIMDTQEELLFAEGATKARQERDASPEPPTSEVQPMRAVTPVKLRSLGDLEYGPGVVAFLLLRDDGMAELRDAADPNAAPAKTVRVFNEGSLPVGQVHAAIQDSNRPTLPRVDFCCQSLWELLFFCEPFRAVIAVVDVLRPSGQLLCSQLLSKGPQGPLVGVIAACPGLDTPAPFAGPSYGALSAALCLGGTKLGLGGFDNQGGVFGRCLAIADRAVAYDGGWPSPQLGKIAFDLASAAKATQGPGGMSGTFLFGQEPGGSEELVGAESVCEWLKGAAQSCHTSRAWVPHFDECHISEAEHNDGPMWMAASAKQGRWPHLSASAGASVACQPAEGEEEEDEEAAAAERAASAAKASLKASVKHPFAGATPSELPVSPSLGAPIPAECKIALPFGNAAAALLGELEQQLEPGSFTVLGNNEGPEAVRPNILGRAEVLFLVDFADPGVIAWPLEVWPQWTDAVRSAGGTIAAVVLLPGPEAAEQVWYASLLALSALTKQFSFVVFLDQTDRRRAHLSVASLLDQAVSMRLMASHLSPFPSLHFAVPYAGLDVADLTSCCMPPAPSEIARPSHADRETLLQRFAEIGVDMEGVKNASLSVANLLQDLVSQSGFRVKEEVEEAVAQDAEAGEGDDLLNADTEEQDAEVGDVNKDEPVPGDDAEVVEGDNPDDVAAETETSGMEAAIAQAVTPTPSATLLSFVVGDNNAAAAVEGILQVRGEDLRTGPEGPSLSYPACSYGKGCVPPKPWGTSWGKSRPEIVAFAVHTRKIFSIMGRILIGVDDDAFSLDRHADQQEQEDHQDEDVAEAQAELPTDAAEGEPEAPAWQAADEKELAEAEAAALKIQQVARARNAKRQSDADATVLDEQAEPDGQAGSAEAADAEAGEPEASGETGEAEACEEAQALESAAEEPAAQEPVAQDP